MIGEGLEELYWRGQRNILKQIWEIYWKIVTNILRLREIYWGIRRTKVKEKVQIYWRNWRNILKKEDIYWIYKQISGFGFGPFLDEINNDAYNRESM